MEVEAVDRAKSPFLNGNAEGMVQRVDAAILANGGRHVDHRTSRPGERNPGSQPPLQTGLAGRAKSMRSDMKTRAAPTMNSNFTCEITY